MQMAYSRLEMVVTRIQKHKNFLEKTVVRVQKHIRFSKNNVVCAQRSKIKKMISEFNCIDFKKFHTSVEDIGSY